MERTEAPKSSLSSQEQDENTLPAPQTTWVQLPATWQAWTLALAILVLALLPLILPFPLYDLAQQQFFPVIDAQLDQCVHDPICQVVTDEARRVWLLIYGPSILAAVIAFLLGVLALIRARWHPISKISRNLCWFITIWGIIWAVMFGCMYLEVYFWATIHDL
jgi:hypothetical protein